MTDIERYRKIAQPPAWALKTIGGGRLKGMTDIKPAWRIQAMTEEYGMCGDGWKFEVIRQWTEPGAEGQVFAFVDVLLYVHFDGPGNVWSNPIPGTGGSMLIEKEKSGLHSNDEAFKMATTDALSSAMKMIGMGADVYAGQWTGTKYNRHAVPPPDLSPDDQRYVEEATEYIQGAPTLEDLRNFGTKLKDKNAAIQAALRPKYAQRQQELNN